MTNTIIPYHHPVSSYHIISYHTVSSSRFIISCRSRTVNSSKHRLLKSTESIITRLPIVDLVVKVKTEFFISSYSIIISYHHPVSSSRIIISYHHLISSSRIIIPYHHLVSSYPTNHSACPPFPRTLPVGLVRRGLAARCLRGQPFQEYEVATRQVSKCSYHRYRIVTSEILNPVSQSQYMLVSEIRKYQF